MVGESTVQGQNLEILEHKTNIQTETKTQRTTQKILRELQTRKTHRRLTGKGLGTQAKKC